MFRPGYIQPLHGATSKTAMHRWMYRGVSRRYPMLRSLMPNHVTTTEDIGRAMIAVVRQGSGEHILHSQEINRAAGGQPFGVRPGRVPPAVRRRPAGPRRDAPPPHPACTRRTGRSPGTPSARRTPGPLHGECPGLGSRRIDIGLQRPHDHRLATGLTGLTQRHPHTVRCRMTELLLELTAGSGLGLLIGAVLPLGHRPRRRLAPCPERAAHVPDEHLEPGAPVRGPEQQKTRTSLLRRHTVKSPQ